MFFQKRLDVFLGLFNANKLDGISVDCSQTNNLLKLLDTVVIKLENGVEEDLALLEQEYSGKALFMIMFCNY